VAICEPEYFWSVHNIEMDQFASTRRRQISEPCKLSTRSISWHTFLSLIVSVRSFATFSYLFRTPPDQTTNLFSLDITHIQYTHHSIPISSKCATDRHPMSLIRYNFLSARREYDRALERRSNGLTPQNIRYKWSLRESTITNHANICNAQNLGLPPRALVGLLMI
jgi:hypothetical protein